MDSSLSMQRSLYAHQRREIASLVQPASAAFRAYEARYHRATRRYRRVVSPAQVLARTLAHDIVHVGDYHTLRTSQQAFAELAESAARLSGRRVVLALEFVEASRQAAVNAYLGGRLSDAAFLRAIGRTPGGPFDLWPGFRAIFEVARQRGLEVLAIDHRAGGPRSLDRRDRFAATEIARAASAADRPLVLVLIGQFHVAPAHLPRHVARALGPTTRRQLTVYQNAEGVWWRLARAGLAEGTRAVELDPHQLCLLSASPVVCQRSFLDYVEAEAGDSPLGEPGLARSMRLMTRELGRLTGVRVAMAAEEVEVVTASDLEGFERIVRRGRFSPAERRQLRRHLLSRESAYIPRARTVWLASLTLNHAAEEATHLVRSLALGEALERERPRRQGYLARCYEATLAFFGSRLLNPARRCLTLEDWVTQAADRAAPQHRLATRVLGLVAALQPGQGRLTLNVPSTPRQVNAASQAFGAVLGDALARGLARGRVTRARVRGLFLDPLQDPETSLRAVVQELRLQDPRRSGARVA
jgi:hypothetical protein